MHPLKHFQQQHGRNLILLFFLIIYTAFPTINSTCDGWGYAAEIKHGYNLFRPHHLLYNAWGYLMSLAGKHLFSDFDVLSFLKFQNGVFGALSLLLLSRIMELMNIPSKRITAWVMFSGSSFAILRYSTENETYIIPIFFSLLSSWSILKALNSNQVRWYIFSGLSAALACLFHQIQIFWTLVLIVVLLRKKDFKSSLWFLLPLSIIPIAYLTTLHFYYHQQLLPETLFKFVLQDYVSGTAKTSFNWTNFVLTPISMVRSFIQVHGIIIILLKNNPWFYFAILAPVMLVTSLFWQKNPFSLLKNGAKTEWLNFHIWILMIQLSFAFYSHGNAEFMVLLPLLFPFLMERWILVREKVIIRLALAMLIWNLGLSIMPSALTDYYESKKVVEFVHHHPEAVFICADKNLIANQYEYIYTTTINNRLLSFDSPDGEFEKLTSGKVKLFTDIVDRPNPTSRSSMLENWSSQLNFKNPEKTLTLNGYLGTYSIYQVSVD
jgi:hypothetical protein